MPKRAMGAFSRILPLQGIATGILHAKIIFGESGVCSDAKAVANDVGRPRVVFDECSRGRCA